MSSAITLPPEVLLLVFENADGYIPGFIDPDALRCASERNATLAACAVVCKSWAAPAQMTLFRDITLGITTDNVDEEEVAHHADNERPGSTTPALTSLVRTLEEFRDNGSKIPHNIRAVHFYIGETDMLNFNPDFEVDYVIHGSPAAVFRAIALCPGLVHLSITLGLYHEDDDRSAAPMFSAEDIAMLKGIAGDLPNLRQLSLQMPNDTDLVMHSGYCFTSYESANTIIAALSDRITLLDVSIRRADDVGGDWPSDDDEAGGGAIDAFPKLHTFRSAGDTYNIRTTILRHAPCLRRAVLFPYRSLAEAKRVAPDSIQELTIGSLREEDDLSSFGELEALEILDFVRVTKTDLPVLKTLPRTLRKLILPATALEVDSMAQKVAEAVRGLPNLESITAVQVPWAQAVVKQVCHLPVHIVPHTQQWQRLIPCTE
ncbi:hypothetical protein EXIGLDRAFT_830443 [Exidia glandulosa HHB12029]|uniref:Uncharacterized protein n=1 Tax=Exidia glandulosa HHB12029 TaxID=1314781 RepID=A0A165NI31_EXIGL|nr:hypothetical protein EXIGLDRAFT_830443 [Exidia glandulosa HHB12029]